MIAAAPVESAVVLFVAALLATALVTPIAMRIALRLGLVDRPAPHKFHQVETPYLGGLAVSASVLAALLGMALAGFQHSEQFLAIGLGGAAVASIGLLDDRATVSPLVRLAVQAMAAVLLFVTGVKVAPTGSWMVDLPATVLVVAGLTNAVNLLDNMDGLSTGTVAIASLFFLALSLWQGQELVSLMTAALAGACLGFLPFNFHPARIFLGDAGTLFMGFLLATIAIEIDLVGHSTISRVVIPMTIVSVPLFDMVLVVVSRLRAGRPVFRGGTDHSSHRLVMLGMRARGAATTTYGAAVAVGGLALLLVWLRSELASWIVLGAGSALAVGLVATFEAVHRDRVAPSTAQVPVVSSARPDVGPGVAGEAAS